MHRHRLARRTTPVLVPLAGLALLSGCSVFSGSSGTSATSTDRSTSSIETSRITRAPSPAQEQDRFSLAYPTGDRKTSALLIEQISPGEVQLNRETSTQLRVTNLTNQTIRGISLRPQAGDGLRLTAAPATQPAGVAASSTNARGQSVVAADPAAYDVGDLGPKESRLITVSAVPTRVGKLDACYAVTAAPQMLCTSLNVVNPMLRLSAAAPADADICQDIVYRYTVANTGTGTARGVVLEGDLPDGLATSDGKHAIAASLGDIPQGETREVTAHLKAARTGKYTSRATARAGDATVQTDPLATAVHAPALRVDVKGPAEEYVGKSVTYDVTVTNTGDAPARQASLKFGTTDAGRVVAVNAADPASPRDAQLAASAQTSSTSGQDLGTIAPGETRQVRVTTQTVSGGTLGLSVDASAACASAARAAVETKVLTVPALLLQAVDEADPVRVGDNVVYDVSVVNQGSGADTNVRVSATLPPGVEFVNVTGATDAQVNGRTLTFAPVPRLAPKESATWKVTAKVVRQGDVQFKASATSDSVKTSAEKVEPTRLY